MSREQRLSRALSPQLREHVLAGLSRDHDNNNCIYDDTQNNNDLYDPTPEELEERVPPIGADWAVGVPGADWPSGGPALGADWAGDLISPDGSLPGMGYSYTYRGVGLMGQTSLDDSSVDEFDDEFMRQWLLICDLREG